MNNYKNELDSFERIHYSLHHSLLKKSLTAMSRKKSRSSIPPQQMFDSMDDIKPVARGIPIILQRPVTIINSNTEIQQVNNILPTSTSNTATSVDTINSNNNKEKPTTAMNNNISVQQETNYYFNSSEESPSVNKPRTRDNTLDSVGLYKTAASVTKFEDIKSEAIDSWKEGVDLKLSTNDNTRKKPKEWLSQDVFFSDGPSSSTSPNEKKNLPEWLQDISPTNITTKKSYAEVIINKEENITPDWVLDDMQSKQIHLPFGYNQNGWSPNKQNNGSNISHHLPQVVMLPSPYMPIQHQMYSNDNTTKKDVEYFNYFYKVIRDCDNTDTLISFQKKIDKILQHYLTEFSPRTFSLLLESLIPLMEYELTINKMETPRRIILNWQIFIYFINRHLQIYLKTPEDLIIILKLFNLLQKYSNKIYKELPLKEIIKIYESIKELFATETSKESIKYLKMLKVIQDNNKSDLSWRDTDEILPSIPNSENLIIEVINNVDILTDYETKKEVRIVNKIHNPWPNLDLLQYNLNHFMLLREELLKPIQNTINSLFSISNSTSTILESIEIPIGCTIYENTIPKSTTMILNSSETSIIFQLGTKLIHDNIMESFKEGSFVILIPEINSKVNPSDQYNIMMNISKNSMIGQSIRATSNQNIRLVSIHINKENLNRINWSTNYTIITCDINSSSTFSILSWLRKEYVDLKKQKYSSVLTPRILAANNTLSNSQINSWYKENVEQEIIINQDCVPFYLLDTEIDVSCLMVNNKLNYKARPGDNIWPRHSNQWEQVAYSKRPPLYNISNSQLSAIQFALTHRISVISGAPGTGKTFIASKLIQLMSQALNTGQFHQPLLVITKSQSCLDDILTQVLPTIPDIIRFGGSCWDQLLAERQASKLTTPSAADTNYRQHQQLERQISKNQGKLNALFLARFQAIEHDPAVMCTIILPDYLKHMQHGYMKEYNQSYSPNYVALWNKWAESDPKTKNFPQAQSNRREFGYTQWLLESRYLEKAGRGLMPMLDTNYMQNRFTWVANNPISISPIVDSTHWPFETSARTGKELRSKVISAWERLNKGNVWNASAGEKTQLIESLSNILVTFIDYEINDVLQDQIKTAKAFDDILTQKLTSLCRYNRVIGMTADFAAAHRNWVSTLWPRAVIVDEASEILESVLVSSILGPRTEHVVLLGNNDNLSKPKLNNTDLIGNPRNFDVSLFERWKGSGGEMVLLEEQWRMCSEVASVIDQFNSIKDESSSLLITAPLASCNENMVDGSKPQEEILYGITQRAFYVDYQEPQNPKKSERYSKLLKLDLTESEVDEARFIAFFAVYLSQQHHPKPSITILTLCLSQKYLIRAILREEIPKRTRFISNLSKITVDTVEQNSGRQDSFTIISTATPAHSFSTWDNISFALTRARYGLFVIGKPEIDDAHYRWKDFANYMKSRELFGTHIQLTCYEHGDTFSVSKYQDFNAMPNGGCSTPCQALMNDGHVCPEVCHFLSHDEVICNELCNRIRPTNCQHECKKKCFECSENGSCPPCEELTTTTLDCGHVVTAVCHSIQHSEEFECKVNVNVKLACEHEVITECYKAKNPKKLVCTNISDIKLPCGHIGKVKCGEDVVCAATCDQFYDCGHPCREMCGIEHSHDRKECQATCPKQLICGHGCAKGCANPDTHTERCVEKCNYICSHGYKCSRDCWRDCIKCVSACPYECVHLKCRKKCYEICDRPPCNESCKIKLDCGHTCPGLCGEPCPPCITCHGELECSISLRTLSEFEKDEKVYVLPECGCVFSVESLDMYFLNQSKNGEHTAVKLWGCPTCQNTIYRAFRYSKFIKTEINLVNTIKLRIEKERQKLTYNEKTQIINAMNHETKQGPHNLVGGRWFVCRNQHPYFVGDCGGATQISKCPECDAPIGGTQHKVVDSNRFYGEFDGSDAPAWPGQPGAPQ